MRVYTRDGQLDLKSAHALFFLVFVISFAALFLIVFAILLVASLITGETMVNGVVIHGRVEVLAATLPIFGWIVLLGPIVAAWNAYWFGWMFVWGLWLYRR